MERLPEPGPEDGVGRHEGGERVEAEVVRPRGIDARAATRTGSRFLRRAAVVAGAGGGLVWWAHFGSGFVRSAEDARSGVAVAVALVVLGLPAFWLVRVSLAVAGLADIPDRLRALQSARTMQERREAYAVWTSLAEVLSPGFWLLTLGALLVTPPLLAAGVLSALLVGL